MNEAPTSSAGLFSVAELADAIGATVVGESAVVIGRVDAMDRADAQTLTFVRDAKRARDWDACKACAAIISREVAEGLTPGNGRALLVVDDADLALIGVLEKLTPAHAAPDEGVHETAVVHVSAQIGERSRIGPYVVVGEGARIGDGCTFHAGVRLGANVTIGNECQLRANVVLEDRCTIADRVVLHAGAVIGADGFGYRPAPDGAGILKIPHAGSVRIGSDVEIGANTTVDRGKFGDTEIGDGSKIDNLVQIGHNCTIGRCCIICGAVGIAGSVAIGDGATIGGGAGIRDNVSIGAGAQVGARSGVMTDIPAGEAWGGTPAMPIKDAMRSYAAWRSLPKTLRSLGQRLRAIEDAQDDS